MEGKTEEEPEKTEIKGARKRKSAQVTRIIQNKESLEEPPYKKLNTCVSEKKNICNVKKEETIKIEPIFENELLKEPEQRITLIERALGSFNTANDVEAQNNPLNQSVNGGPPFTCDICKSWFYLGEKLKLHYLLNHNIYHCDICSSLFETEDERNTHSENMHNTVQCEICQDELGRHDIWFHYDQDHDAVACTYCGSVLRPKGSYEDHFESGHKVTKEFLTTNPEKIAVVKNDDKDFFCSLCNKLRRSDNFFGHMRSYHKITTTQLMNIVCKQKINITITGTTVEERTKNEIEEILPLQNQKFTKMSCDVCEMRYNDKIYAGFHHVYCQQKLQCYYCNHYFETETRRERHIKKNHIAFICTYGCDIPFITEDKLQEHYIEYHELTNCRYCEQLFTLQEAENHMSEVHQYTANVMKNFTETLFEVTEIENQHIVICCLCEDNLTSLIDNVEQLFDHFYSEHNVSNKKILRLITPKPSVREYDEFYKEINKSIDSESEFSDEDLKENKENECSNFEDTNIELDFDPQEVECVLDSDFDEVMLNCPICSVENINVLDFLIHIKEKHKVFTKYKEYECKVCSELFLSETGLNKHIFTSHDVSEDTVDLYNCCSEQPFKCIAREHILEKHSFELEKHDVQVFGLKCRFCDRFFWEKVDLNEHEVNEHLMEHEKEFLKCAVCFSSFSDQYCLKTHTDVDHSDYHKYTEISYKCLNCSIAYPNISELRDHFRKLHFSSMLYHCPLNGCTKMYKVLKYIKLHLKKPHKSKPENFDTSPCDLCGVKLRSARSLNVHMIVKHRREKLGFMCRICKERFQTIEQRKLHCATSHPGEVSYACRDCGKGFISKSGLYGHRKIHAENTVITCPYCSKEFTRRDSYGEHLLIHIGPKHQCPHCPKLFTQRSNLIRHVRIHTGTKPYSCCYCDKRFSDQGAKRSHERVHTKEEHCECSECGKKFTKWQKLKYHMKLHTGIGLLTCEICQKQFTNNYSLNEHKRVHDTGTLIMCECGRGFTTEKYLLRHQQNVHGKGPPKFTCPICFKELYRRTGFEDHMLIHAGNKQFTCLLCNKECYTRRTIRRHITNKHKIKSEEIDKHIQQTLQTGDKVNLTELLNDSELLQVDIIELENLNGTDIKIKEEPLSEGDEDDKDDEDYVKEKKRRDKIKPVRSSPRNKNNPKLYFTDFSDDES